MPLPPNGKSILMTPDPYHTPGYGGFCPQFKYKIGETFGKTTSSLLRDENVASSGMLVLADIRPRSVPADHVDPTEALLRSRTHSWGDQKLVENMIPGYTGMLYSNGDVADNVTIGGMVCFLSYCVKRLLDMHAGSKCLVSHYQIILYTGRDGFDNNLAGFIPKSQNYFGNRYVINCKHAISDFEMDNYRQKEKLEELKITDALQSGKPVNKSRVPNLPDLMYKSITGKERCL